MAPRRRRSRHRTSVGGGIAASDIRLLGGQKLDLLRREVPVGAHVTLRLTRGEDVSGRVLELQGGDDAYIRLDRDGDVVMFFEDLVAGWEIHLRDTPGDAAATDDAASPEDAADSSRPPGEPDNGSGPAARGSERDGWCLRESVRESFDGAALDELLADLETRDVVERKGAAYRLRVGLFRDWLVLRD